MQPSIHLITTCIMKTHITAHLHECIGKSISVYQIKTHVYIISFDPYQIIYCVYTSIRD